MHIAVVMDPIQSVNYKKDSTLAMLWAAAARGHQLSYLEVTDLFLRDGQVHGHLAPLQVAEDPACWYSLGEAVATPLATWMVLPSISTPRRPWRRGSPLPA